MDFEQQWKQMTLQQRRELAVFAAEQVLDFFEQENPDDKRPRLAIEAAKKVIENDTEENRKLANNASNPACVSHILAHISDVAGSGKRTAHAAAHVVYAAVSAAASESDTIPDTEGPISIAAYISKYASRVSACTQEKIKNQASVLMECPVGVEPTTC